MTPNKTGASTSIVKGVRPHTPTLASAHHKGNCLPGAKAPTTGYGSKSFGTTFPEVPGQCEPTAANLTKQHHNYATQGLGSDNHGLKKELGL